MVWAATSPFASLPEKSLGVNTVLSSCMHNILPTKVVSDRYTTHAHTNTDLKKLSYYYHNVKTSPQMNQTATT